MLVNLQNLPNLKFLCINNHHFNYIWFIFNINLNKDKLSNKDKLNKKDKLNNKNKLVHNLLFNYKIQKEQVKNRKI